MELYQLGEEIGLKNYEVSKLLTEIYISRHMLSDPEDIELKRYKRPRMHTQDDIDDIRNAYRLKLNKKAKDFEEAAKMVVGLKTEPLPPEIARLIEIRIGNIEKRLDVIAAIINEMHLSFMESKQQSEARKKNETMPNTLFHSISDITTDLTQNTNTDLLISDIDKALDHIEIFVNPHEGEGHEGN